ncbi:hypothetical protein EDD11_010199, partial [Mortierella claussenii]
HIPLRIITMALFKSSKNQSASAAVSPAASPAATPRSSIQEQRPAHATKMTQEQALEMLYNKAMTNAAAGHFVR